MIETTEARYETIADVKRRLFEVMSLLYLERQCSRKNQCRNAR